MARDASPIAATELRSRRHLRDHLSIPDREVDIEDCSDSATRRTPLPTDAPGHGAFKIEVIQVALFDCHGSTGSA
jgi:hypothetical protein